MTSASGPPGSRNGDGAHAPDPRTSSGPSLRRMTFGLLALVVVAGLAGPLLALPGPLAPAGRCSASWSRASCWARPASTRSRSHDPTLTFLADIGFALVMFVAGTQVPVGDPSLRRGVRLGAAARGRGRRRGGRRSRSSSTPLFDTGHTGLYAVLMASSSAALVLPIVDSPRLSGPAVLQVLPQVAIADAACIVALPLAIDPARAGRAALGALAVCACAAALFVAAAALRAQRVRGPGCTQSRSAGRSRSSCGSSWPSCSPWRRSPSRRTCRSCWPASPSAWPWRRSVSRGGWPSSCSR